MDECKSDTGRIESVGNRKVLRVNPSNRDHDERKAHSNDALGTGCNAKADKNRKSSEHDSNRYFYHGSIIASALV